MEPEHNAIRFCPRLSSATRHTVRELECESNSCLLFLLRSLLSFRPFRGILLAQRCLCRRQGSEIVSPEKETGEEELLNALGGFNRKEMSVVEN